MPYTADMVDSICLGSQGLVFCRWCRTVCKSFCLVKEISLYFTATILQTQYDGYALAFAVAQRLDHHRDLR